MCNFENLEKICQKHLATLHTVKLSLIKFLMTKLKKKYFELIRLCLWVFV